MKHFEILTIRNNISIFSITHHLVRPWCYTITYYINLISYNVVCFAILQNILREHDAARCNGL